MTVEEKKIIIENNFIPLYIDWKYHQFIYLSLKERGFDTFSALQQEEKAASILAHFEDMVNELDIMPSAEVLKTAQKKAVELAKIFLESLDK